MAYIGNISCSKCFKEYQGVDYIGNLCPKCLKEKEEKTKEIAVLLFQKFKEYPERDHLLFDFLMSKFDVELTGYLIKKFDVKIEKDEIVFR